MRILDRGTEWKNSFKEMWNDSALAVGTITIKLNVSVEKAKLLALEMELSFERPQVKYSNVDILTEPTLPAKSLQQLAQEIMIRRKRWLDTIAANPGATVRTYH